MHPRAVRLLIAVLLASPLVAGPIVESSASAATPKLVVTAASTRPDSVTGGDVLLRLRPAATASPRFSAGGQSLTASQLDEGNIGWCF